MGDSKTGVARKEDFGLYPEINVTWTDASDSDNSEVGVGITKYWVE